MCFRPVCTVPFCLRYLFFCDGNEFIFIFWPTVKSICERVKRTIRFLISNLFFISKKISISSIIFCFYQMYTYMYTFRICAYVSEFVNLQQLTVNCALSIFEITAYIVLQLRTAQIILRSAQFFFHDAQIFPHDGIMSASSPWIISFTMSSIRSFFIYLWRLFIMRVQRK